MLIIIFLAILVVLLTLWILRMEKKMKVLLATKNADRIDDTLEEIQNTVGQLYTFSRRADTHIKDLEERMQCSLRGTDIIRYNPFAGDGSGGNNSFSMAFVNERGDGIVLSSMYTRERTNVFSKHLEGLTPSHDLSDEEAQVVHRAHQKIARNATQ